MNLLEFRASLRARVGNPTTGEVADTELDDRINESVSEIADKYGFHQARKVVTFDTVMNTPRYVLPTDCLVLMKLRHPLENVQLRKRDETWASSRMDEEAGKPKDYLRERDWIQLFPTPDGVYTLEMVYKASPARLTADGDTPVTPVSWDEGVLLLARAKHWDVRLDVQKAVHAFSVWERWVSTKPSEINEELFADDTEGVIIPTLKPIRRRRYFDE